MIRFLFKSAVMVVLLLGLSSYAAYLMTGRPLWEWLKLPAGADFNPSMPEVAEPVADALPTEKQPVYKWRDADGVIQYSNQPPPPGVDARPVQLEPGMNVVGGEAPRDGGSSETGDGPPPLPSAESESDAPPLYSPDGIQKLVDDARDAKKQLEERDRQRRETLNNR